MAEKIDADFSEGVAPERQFYCPGSAFGTSFGVSSHDAAYLPLALAYYDSASNAEGWSINFQATPTPKIIRRGRKPTQDELLKVCAQLNGCPAWFVQILEIVVATTEAE